MRASDPRAGILVAAMREAGRKAAEPVAEAARAAVPNDSGTLAGDIRVTAARTGAGVRMGRKTVPYAGWVEFGGKRQNPHLSLREFIPDGRYLFPAARGMGPQVVDAYSSALTHAFDDIAWTNETADPEAVHD